MAGWSIRSLTTVAATAALGLALGACTNTYGTGTPAGMQTLQDLAGIADLGGPQKDPIDYKARPKLVAPPPGTPLPVPGSDKTTVASNWPTDPDAQLKQFKADVAAREAACKKDNTLQACQANFTLPPQPAPTEPPILKTQEMLQDPASQGPMSSEKIAATKKLFADAHGLIAVDANGNPVRRYLTDPPSDYRVPDPNAPVEFDNKPAVKKVWKWPWEQ